MERPESLLRSVVDAAEELDQAVCEPECLRGDWRTSASRDACRQRAWSYRSISLGILSMRVSLQEVRARIQAEMAEARSGRGQSHRDFGRSHRQKILSLLRGDWDDHDPSKKVEFADSEDSFDPFPATSERADTTWLIPLVETYLGPPAPGHKGPGRNGAWSPWLQGSNDEFSPMNFARLLDWIDEMRVLSGERLHQLDQIQVQVDRVSRWAGPIYRFQPPRCSAE